jgi:hypothetical protein
MYIPFGESTFCVLLVKQEVGIGGVITDEPVVGATSVAKDVAGTAQDVAATITGDRIAVRVASRVSENTSLTVANRGYFHFMSPSGLPAPFFSNLQT